MMSRDIFDLKDQFLNGCYIIGKGVSLDNVTPGTFHHKGFPIVCLNQSIHYIEAMDLPNRVFMLQNEASLQDACRPKEATILVGSVTKKWYTDYPNQYVFTSSMFGLPSIYPWAIANALGMAKTFGCKVINMIAFDCYTHGDIAYAKQYPETCEPVDLRYQKTAIEPIIHGMNINWITPIAPVLSSDDILELSPNSLEARGEPSP